MRTRSMRSKISLLFMAFAMMLAIPAVALAAELVTSELDTTTPNKVTVEQGKSANFNIGLKATGSISSLITSGNPSTATVDTAYSLDSAGTFTKTTPSSAFKFFSSGQGCSGSNCNVTWTGAPAPYSVEATVSAAANTPVGTYSLSLSPSAGDTSVSNPSVSGGKLDDATASVITIEVVAPAIADADGDGVADASDNCVNVANANQADADSDGTGDVCDPTPNPNTAPNVSVAGVTDGASYEKGSVPTVTCDVRDAEDTNESASPVIDSSDLNGYGLGSEKVTCSYTDAGGLKASDSKTYTIVDTTAPELTLPANITEEATGANGATVNFSASANDAVYGNVSVSCSPSSGSTFGLGPTTVDCEATDGSNNTARGSFTVTVKDTTAPKLTLPADITKEATGPNGNEVTYSASATDAVDPSVAVSCTPNSGSMFAIDTTTVNCEATDAAGNKATGSFTIKVQDTTAPTNIQFVGNISDNDPFFFGDVPAAPTCTADDSGSGIQGCVVTGYSTAVGTHTLTATATDKAGNKSTKTLSYTVKPYTFNGFYQPVNMGGTLNTVKGGSTVPLKFELFKGATELTSTSYINQPLQTQKVNCTTGTTEDTIELLATGDTSLRYDSTGGQYIYNWKTPTGADSCYKVTVSATDGSSITAYFKLK